MFSIAVAQATASPIRLRTYVWKLLVFWTIAVAVVLACELRDEKKQAFDVARSEAMGIWRKEDAMYRWAQSHGGLYVPRSDSTHANPDPLATPEHDISMPSGGKLTLISPTTIMQQVITFSSELSRIRGHVASMRPIHPENAPDPWEKRALDALAAGQTEVCSEETIDGQRYLRFMRLLDTKPSHPTGLAEPDDTAGHRCDGLSITLSMDSVWNTQRKEILHRLIGYGGTWILGLCGIGLMSRHLHRQISRRDAAEKKLQEAHDLLEQRVAERTAQLATANDALKDEIAERTQAERWLLESEERFRGYFEQGLVGMAILGAQRDWIEVNNRLCKMLGLPQEELLLKTWQDLTHADDRHALESEFQQLLSGASRRFVAEVRLVRKDGKALPAGISAQSLKKPDGTVDCVLILVQDMTQRNAASMT